MLGSGKDSGGSASGMNQADIIQLSSESLCVDRIYIQLGVGCV